MAHFAKLNELNIVETVIVVDNINLLSEQNIEEEEIGIQYLKSIFGQDTVWVQTSYNSNFIIRLAQEGFFYDVEKDAFISPKPFNSWVFSNELVDWIPPKEYPNDGNYYNWDESILDWVLLQ